MKVTSDSFARHVGIPRSTFQMWVKRSGKTPAAGAQPERDRVRESIQRMSPQTTADPGGFGPPDIRPAENSSR